LTWGVLAGKVYPMPMSLQQLRNRVFRSGQSVKRMQEMGLDSGPSYEEVYTRHIDLKLELEERERLGDPRDIKIAEGWAVFVSNLERGLTKAEDRLRRTDAIMAKLQAERDAMAREIDSRRVQLEQARARTRPRPAAPAAP
jgi:hypothetical protein